MLHGLPHDRCFNASIVVGNQIAHRFNLLPRNLWCQVRDVYRQSGHRFADVLQSVKHCVEGFLISAGFRRGIHGVQLSMRSMKARMS